MAKNVKVTNLNWVSVDGILFEVKRYKEHGKTLIIEVKGLLNSIIAKKNGKNGKKDIRLFVNKPRRWYDINPITKTCLCGEKININALCC